MPHMKESLRDVYFRHQVVSQGDNENFRITFAEPIINLSGLEVEWVNVTNSLPTIIAGYNDTLQVDYNNSGPVTITLSEGQYTTASLRTEFNLQLNTISVSFGVTVSIVEMLNVSAGSTFDLDFTDSLAGYYLGFDAESYTSIVNDIVAVRPVNVVPYQAISIESKEVNKYVERLGVDPAGYSTDTLITTPVDFPFLSTIRYQPYTKHLIWLDLSTTLESIDFTLVTYYADGSKVPVGVFPISTWSMCLGYLRKDY